MITLVWWLCLLYTAANLIRGWIQHRRAAGHNRLARGPAAGTVGDPTEWLAVDVLVPCYNEQPALLDACLDSLWAQDYPGRLRVFVVDDGSRNGSSIASVLNRHENNRSTAELEVRLLPRNVGKRRAQDTAFSLGDGELVVTIDSDTVLAPDAIRQIVTPLADQRVGAVCGSLRALNPDDNWLTRLIDRSYFMLFEQERAAQSLDGLMVCSCGGFSAYRRTALKEVWDRHQCQTFLGQPCRTGDDLHLTLRLLHAGFNAVLQPSATGRTHVPNTLRNYSRQQRRWNRSLIRELPQALRVVAHRPSPAREYLFFDLIVQVFSPVLLGLAATLLGLATVLSLAELTPFALESLVGGLGSIVGAALVTSAGAAVQARDAGQPRDLGYWWYGLVYHLVIAPGFLLALITPGHDTWKTRETERRTRRPGPPTAHASSGTRIDGPPGTNLPAFSGSGANE